MLLIAPSILAADLARLGEEVEDVRRSGADLIHFDVMDGLFVPNISVGVPVLRSLRKTTELPLDVHLMIERPLRYVETFCAAGADFLSLHLEADSAENIRLALEKTRALGKKAGLVLKPATPAEAARPFLPFLDFILVMTVEPGFGGQRFMVDMLPKIEEIKTMLDALDSPALIEVDGGVDENTAPLVVRAGARMLVAGSSVFGKSDRAAAIAAIRAADSSFGA